VHPARAFPASRELAGGRGCSHGLSLERRPQALDRVLELERQAILATLKSTGGNRTRAAEQLGISLRTLQRKLKEYQVEP